MMSSMFWVPRKYPLMSKVPKKVLLGSQKKHPLYSVGLENTLLRPVYLRKVFYNQKTGMFYEGNLLYKITSTEQLLCSDDQVKILLCPEYL